MPATAQIRYTFEDWVSIPEDPSRLYEIVDGELFVGPPPRPRHQQVAVSLTRILSTLAVQHGLGEVLTSPVGVRLENDTVTEPDVLFVASDRLHIVDWDGYILGPPDLVVEILSPSNREYDRTLKRKRYLASGVAELWIVDSDEHAIEVWRPGEDARMVSSGSVEWSVGEKTFEIPLAEIFRG
jgi:Uma2 family endonuclease